MKKIISILLFSPLLTLSAMDGDGRESQLKKLKSCKKLESQLTPPQEERGEAELKKLKVSLSDPKELVEEVYSAKTERGEAEFKKARIALQPTIEDLLREAKQRNADNNPKEAIELLEEALPLCQNVNQLYSTNYSLGFLYGYKMPQTSKYALASCNYLNNALKALELIHPNNDPEVCSNRKGVILRALSTVHLKQKNLTQAVICAEEALIYEKRPLAQVIIHHLLGLSLRPKNREASCLHFQSGINKMLNMIKEKDSDEKKEWVIKADEEKSILYGNLLKEIANTHFINFSLDEAQTNYEKALNFVRSSWSKGTIWVQLGLIYHKKAKKYRACKEHELSQRFAQSAQVCFKKASQEDIKHCNVAAYNLAKTWLNSHPG